MGMGVDVHGRDATKAARRAVSDAIRHSSLGFFRMLGKTANDMFVEVTVAVPDPSGVDTAAVARELPYGTVNVTAVNPGASGNLRLFAHGEEEPLASTLNFSAGRTRANNAIASIGVGLPLSVKCDMLDAAASTHLVMDVFGYFR